MKSNIWFKTGLVIIYGSSIDASPHCHNAIQLVWSRDGACCKLDNKATSTPLIRRWYDIVKIIFKKKNK